MRVAITGASGYLGSNFISMYRDGCGFVALTRNAATAAGSTGMEYRESDYSVESLKDIFSGCDAVIHLAYAMATKDNEQGGLQSYASSMLATENVFEAACEMGISNIVFASSRLVYSNYSDEPFRETDQPAPTTFYGRSKAIMEDLCGTYNSKGTKIKALRFGQIIGADMKVKGMFHIFMERASKNEPITLIGSDVRDYIYVKDACRAIMAALQHPEASGIFNISMGTGTDNRAMADAVIRATESCPEIIVKEAAAGKKPDRIVLDCAKANAGLGFECEYDTIYKIAMDVLHEGHTAVGV